MDQEKKLFYEMIEKKITLNSLERQAEKVRGELMDLYNQLIHIRERRMPSLTLANGKVLSVV